MVANWPPLSDEAQKKRETSHHFRLVLQAGIELKYGRIQAFRRTDSSEHKFISAIQQWIAGGCCSVDTVAVCLQMRDWAGQCCQLSHGGSVNSIPSKNLVV